MDSQNMNSQDEGMYFTNLLGQDPQLGVTSLVTYDDSPSLFPNNPTCVKKSRGVNFSIEVDKLLVSAWLNCSVDDVQGTDQKYFQLWEKIFTYFQQFRETTIERTMKSLSLRWSIIQKGTNKFCSCLAQVERVNQSGTTELDKFEKAKIMYHSQEKCNFQFEHCWSLLKEQPKWILHVSKDDIKQRMTPNRRMTPINLETTNVIENEVVELDRPIGKKSEKEKRKAQGRHAEEIVQLGKMKFTFLEESRAQEKELCRLKSEKMEYDKEKEKNKIRQEDERLRLEAEKMEIAKLESDERRRLEAEKMELAKLESDQRIMMMDVSIMLEMQRQYFEGLQREIMRTRNQFT